MKYLEKEGESFWKDMPERHTSLVSITLYLSHVKQDIT